MAEQVVDEKSDDLDIVSTGKLYQGPWEKKYWSSSRGKDRHPYPVGYVAQRTYNGNTYKMAILEGLKGPEFAISSTDGESCSGQTPDIAWDGFQKNSCVRIKFWRGKRFSCKIDGAELFGFKNPLVARLLRGLKANASPIAEQSLPSSCFGNEQSKGTRKHLHSAETWKYPDLQVNLVKTEGKEKRSKKRKEVHVKPVSGAKHKRERPQDLTQSGHENHSNGIPLCSSNSNENKPGLETMAYNGNSKSNLLSAEDGLQFNSSISSKHLEKEKCAAVPEARNSIGFKDLASIEDGINLLKNQENLDVSIITRTPEPTSLKTADEKGDSPVQKGSQIMNNVDLYAPDTMDPALADEKGDPPFKKDSRMLDDVDLCAADTLDSALDGTCNPEVILEETNCSIKEKLNAAQSLVSEKSVTESQSKDEMVIGTGSDNSYKSDSDSVGHEITNSMMTLLLPRALPLLKTYSRKKKKDGYDISQEERKGTNQCLEDEPPAKSFEELHLENHQCVEDSTAIAPDSFENHQCEPMESSQAGQVQDAVRADQNTCGMDSCTNVGDHVCANVQLSEEVWHVGKTTNKTQSNQDVDLVLEKSPQRSARIMDSYDLGNISPSRKDPELTDVKISPCHIQGTATTVDARSTSPLSLISTDCGMTKMVHNDEEVKDESCLNKSHNNELQNVFELVGCYVHPTPISMVMLRTKGNVVFIFVLCGYFMENNRTLFVYNTSIKGERKGHPSFIGHTKIISPISKNVSGDQIMQFTPDGKCLVLLNHINAPYCREGGVNCQFSACTPDSFEKNAVKVVQVKIGYVHVVCKLKTTDNVCCILVCEPSYLVAAEESGRVNVWTMNSTWSAATEHSYLPTSGCMSNTIIELKRIPNFPVLVVGHTAFGDFCLWDLTRRILVSKFSAPQTSFVPFIPISLFRCPKGVCRKEQVLDIIEETQRGSLETDKEDLSLVLLVSNHDLNSENSYKDSGCWSLALLAKNKLILLTALDPSATLAGASAGYGIIGTCIGPLYIWELSSGTNLGYLSHCRGATVSCLAADDSGSGVFAVAVDGSQLQVYATGTSEYKNHE